MKMNKLTACLLALCLCLASCPALAAPTRDMRTVEVTDIEKLNTLLFILAQAIPEECFGDTAQTVLACGDAPGAAFAAKALWAACLAEGSSGVLSQDDAASLYSQLFTIGPFDLSGQGDLVFLKETEEGYEIDPHVSSFGNLGVYLYEAVFDGKDVNAQCDLFVYEGGNKGRALLSADELNEASVTWRCSLTLSLRFAPEMKYGFTLNSLSLSPAFRWGNFSRWEEMSNEEYAYTVCLPEGLAPAGEASLWRGAEGDVSFSIKASDGGVPYDQAFADYKLKHPDEKVIQDRLYDCFYILSPGLFEMVVTGEDYPGTYTVTLSFPADRQAEFSLYAEIIRNSFSVWGMSNG